MASYLMPYLYRWGSINIFRYDDRYDLYSRKCILVTVIPTGEITSLTRASTKGDSLRTTVPAGIVRQFKLEDKGELEWEIVSRGNKLAILVRPLK
jgi:hypothetical protein